MPSVPVRTRSAQWFRGTFAREKCRVTLQKQPAKGNLPCVHARPVGSFSAGLLLLNKSVRLFCALLQSPSTRRVWIEINVQRSAPWAGLCHPPRGGCGLKSRRSRRRWKRLCHPPRGGCGLKSGCPGLPDGGQGSPSTRRVWIEIAEAKSGIAFGASHPPRGGCGLKLLSEQPEPQGLESPSTRRVWIEIAIKAALLLGNIVTLHAEGVD